MSAVAFAALILVFMLSFQLGSYEAMVNSSVKIHTGHLQIQHQGYEAEPKMRLAVPSPDETARRLDRIGTVAAYTFRAEAFSVVSSENRTRGVLVTGIDPGKEPAVSSLKAIVKQGTFLEPGDTDRVLVGNLLARHLQAGVGDELTLIGQAKDGSVAACAVRIKGIFSSGIDEFDRRALHMPLAYFQEIYAMGSSVHKIVAVADSLFDVEGIKKKLVSTLDREDHLTVLDWKQLMPGLVQGIKLDLSSAAIFYFILVIVVAFSILNTFLMAVLERKKEFGVMLAVGVKPGRLMKLVLMESTALTLAGVLTGCLGGTALTLWFQAHGIDLAGLSEILKEYGMSGKVYPRLSAVSLCAGPLAVLFITVVSALYPAVKVTGIEPADAVKGL